MPEEDRFLCKHEYCDLYGGFGVSRNDPKLALVVFYCKYCLQIRIRSYRQDMFAISKDFLEDFNENNGEGVV